jgi:hypothetical protein
MQFPTKYFWQFNWTTGVRIPVWVLICFIRHRIQTNTETYPVAAQWEQRAPFSVVKRAGCEADPSLPVPMLRVSGTTLPMRWCLLTSGKFYCTLKTNRTEFLTVFEHNVHTPITWGRQDAVVVIFPKKSEDWYFSPRRYFFPDQHPRAFMVSWMTSQQSWNPVINVKTPGDHSLWFLFETCMETNKSKKDNYTSVGHFLNKFK